MNKTLRFIFSVKKQVIFLLSGLLFFACNVTAQVVYSNTDTIFISEEPPVPVLGKPYPSAINVSGVKGIVSNVTVTLYGFQHNFPDAVDLLLVAPDGTNTVLMSDVGGAADINGIDITLDDAAPNSLPDRLTFSSGTYKPTNIDSLDAWPSPAPVASKTALLSSFNGVDPNGTWKLYAVSDLSGTYGMISGGWSLTLTIIRPSKSVKFKDLNAVYQKELNSVVLNWSTEYEYNTKSFVIERSTPGQNWVTAGEIAAAGFSTTGGSYTFNDVNLPDDRYFYRIKMIGKDQSVEYSSIETVLVKNTSYSVFPNPASSYTYVLSSSIQPESVVVTFTDASQNVLFQKQGTVSTFSPLRVELNNLRPGTYFMIITSGVRQTVQAVVVV
jgi:hypothetical protein